MLRLRSAFYYSGVWMLVRYSWDAVKTNPCFCTGLVSKQKSKGEKTEERCRKTEMGSVLQKHEEVAGQLQIWQRQHSGGGHGQRRWGLLHRYTLSVHERFQSSVAMFKPVRFLLFNNCLLNHFLKSISGKWMGKVSVIAEIILHASFSVRLLLIILGSITNSKGFLLAHHYL